MTLPKGANSGRGRGWGKACPRRVVDEPAAVEPVVFSSFKPRTTPMKQSTKGPSRKSRPDTRTGHKRTEAEAEMQAAWILAVLERSEGRDEVTGADLKPGWDGHHVLPQSVLWSMRRRLGLSIAELAVWLWDVRNSMALNESTHDPHTSTMARIPRSALRDWHWEYAHDLDLLLPGGTQWATVRLEQLYPVRGGA